MKLSKKDIETYIELYNSRYTKIGYSPQTLGWYTGKQNLRFHIATKDFGDNIQSVLDIGCGFADLYIYLNSKGKCIRYTGIDINQCLLSEARANIERHALIVPPLIIGDVLDFSFSEKYDAIIAIGITSFQITDQDNYNYIESIIARGFDLANFIFIIDFCSDCFNHNSTTYGCEYNPIRVLQIVRKFTNRVTLLCDYFPTEFMIKMYKDNSYNSSFIFNNSIYDYE